MKFIRETKTASWIGIDNGIYGIIYQGWTAIRKSWVYWWNNAMWKYHGDVIVSEIIQRGASFRCVTTYSKRRNLYSASKDVGDVQECGNYKDRKFTSHTIEVWEKSWFNILH